MTSYTFEFQRNLRLTESHHPHKEVGKSAKDLGGITPPTSRLLTSVGVSSSPWGYPNGSLDGFWENPIYKWMMTWGAPMTKRQPPPGMDQNHKTYGD